VTKPSCFVRLITGRPSVQIHPHLPTKKGDRASWPAFFALGEARHDSRSFTTKQAQDEIATLELALSGGEILRLRLRMTGSEGACNDKGRLNTIRMLGFIFLAKQAKITYTKLERHHL
jgi:hypothetical protein